MFRLQALEWLEQLGQKKMAARATPDKVTVAAPRQTDDHASRAASLKGDGVMLNEG
jgi:hypothetical protein